MSYTIRRATPEDKPEWLHMRQGLWPDAPREYLELDLDRAYAEACDTSPVGYIEAWYVDPHVRGQKLGRELVHAAEHWAREKGVTEMASDTWLGNEASIQAHYRLGYWEVDRLVHFVKKL
jgi:aminoglycoside 6'-N-acetyltransferase I